MTNTILESINDRKISISNGEIDGNFELPVFLSNNLKHNLRKYQIEAFENFILLNNKENKIESILKKYNSKNNHHLFHMATGSGKTMLMAATIIYLNSLGYKRFIFTTNQTNLISKTKLNLLPSLNSSKCEFKNKFIETDNSKIYIKEVNNFSKYSNDIEIIFTTIHNLHNKINEVKENSINLNDLKDNKIAILADEAHHFQSNSKSTTIEKDNKSWEDTIQILLNVNDKNKLIDFTATMDLSNKDILEKYKDKLIFDYTLKSFREDGYSKEISLIQNNNKEERILQAILINQYRYEIGLNNNINVIPKILFKSSGNIEDLEKEKDYILSLIGNFNLDKLNELLKKSNLSYINKLNTYLCTEKKKEEFISLIKKQFNNNTSLIIHSKDKNKEDKLSIANNLDRNESIRMIFAIDMLNEGWDVLSLFDIVKIDEIEKNTIKKSTTSEIQLIGRGARIFPYKYTNEFGEEIDRFKRKFDNNVSNELRLLEDMNFYSVNDNSYINNLKKELIQIGLKDEAEENKIVVKVKPQNELNEFAKFLLDKFVYSNSLDKKFNKESLISQYDINIQILKDYDVKEENIIDNSTTINHKINKSTYDIKQFIVEHNNQFILNSALNSISYFNMNNIISNYKISSRKELVQDIISVEKNISITLSNKEIHELNFDEKYKIIKEILLELQKQLERKRNIKIGSKSFKQKFKISDTFKEYSKNETSVKDINKDNKIINKSLFYYDNISWDSNLELELYYLFDEKLDVNNFLVIRNEVGFKMYNPFTQENNVETYTAIDKNIFDLNGEGFEPDFIVLKKGNDNQIFQYFIEVKGAHLTTNKENEWKEYLLLEINKEEIIIDDNIEYKIIGLPFFTEEDNKNDSKKEAFIKKIN